ncbi:MAG: sugar phosphate isomerase/epimerase [Candidatus Sumerlaeota bacterium]|nr:sugar phosphate isomerase/epimerase [Candidatus Sumerlaeota bacterium]
MFEGVGAHGITWYNAGRVKENWKPIYAIYREMKIAGYDGVEHDKRLPTKFSAAELKDIAAECGLRWVGHSLPVPNKPDDAPGWAMLQSEIQTAKSLGVKVGTSGVGGRPKTPAERQERLAAAAKVMEKAAALCKAEGIALAAHNHWGTLLENREEIERLLDLAPSLSLLLDTAHLELCGGGVLDVIRKRGDRIAHVHLKDLDVNEPLVTDERLGVPRQWPNFKELGQGGLDLAGMLKALAEIGYSGWISVELDWAARDPLDAHTACRKHLKQLGC